MNIQQLYTNCLAQGAYFIVNNGEAAVIDPLRETIAYLELAAASGAQIKYIFETHFHADFVSGHLDLAAKTGATIVYGPTALTAFNAHIATDGERFRIGGLTLEVLHTPGHTLESTCYLLRNPVEKEIAIFTGDTLFIGDVGRPDLAQQSNGGISKEDLAGMLYDSLKNKIMPLADDVIIYPAHGAGSACGKNLSTETWDTLGHQKVTNYALNPSLTKEQFIIELTSGLSAPPAYFPMNVRLNSQGYPLQSEVINQGYKSLSPYEFRQLSLQPNILLLDTRSSAEFTLSHIPGAANIGLRGSFAPWVGALLPHDNTKILIVADPGSEKEVITRLSRIGYDCAIGYLEGGMAAWSDYGGSTASVKTISAFEFANIPLADNVQLIDVRSEGEFELGHLPNAINAPLSRVSEFHDLFAPNQISYVYCAGGYRSMIFISLLQLKNDLNLINIDGGYNALQGL